MTACSNPPTDPMARRRADAPPETTGGVVLVAAGAFAAGVATLMRVLVGG